MPKCLLKVKQYVYNSEFNFNKVVTDKTHSNNFKTTINKH